MLTTDHDREQFADRLLPEAELFLLWRKGAGLPSRDGTFWTMESDLAQTLFELTRKFPNAD